MTYGTFEKPRFIDPLSIRLTALFPFSAIFAAFAVTVTFCLLVA